MRVIVPFAKLWPETQAALEADGRQAEYHSVAGSDTAYFDLLQQVWSEGRGFINVEQDIVPWPGALAELEACPRPWCGFAYQLSTGFDSYLGCARFSEDLVRNNPGVFAAIRNIPHFELKDKIGWNRLDTRLKQILEDHCGLTMHVHWPAVGHLNPAQQFKGAVNCVRCGGPVPWSTLTSGPPPYNHDCEVPAWTPPIEPLKPDQGTNTVLITE